MGQQQILLVILVTILVGIATVVAINTLQSSHDAANYSAIQQDILAAQSHAMAYLQRSVAMGGGGGSYQGITLQALNLPAANENAAYSIEEATDQSLVIVAVSARGFLVTATIEGNEIAWQVD